MSDDITKVGPIDPSKRTSEILPEEGADNDHEERAFGCYLNGNFYGHFHHVCSGGHLLRCDGDQSGTGKWRKVGVC